MLHIISGPIRSGKTTSLFRFAGKIPGIDGVLQPVISDKRFLYCISTRELIPLEAKDNENDIQAVGHYQFSTAAFQRAEQHIRQCIYENRNVIIIDEFGKLELAGRGIRAAADEAITWSLCSPEHNLVMVIREQLLTQSLALWPLTGADYRIAKSIDDIQ